MRERQELKNQLLSRRTFLIVTGAAIATTAAEWLRHPKKVEAPGIKPTPSQVKK